MIEEGLARLAALIESLGRPAAVIGGIAIIARVGTRTTRDVDVLMALGPEDVAHVTAVAKEHGYAFDPDDLELFEEGLIRMWPAESGSDGFGADIIFADAPYLLRVLDRATPVTLGAVTLPVAQLEDLVLLKLEANRALDIEDVLSIKDAAANTLDMDLLREEAGVLGLADKVALYFDD